MLQEYRETDFTWKGIAQPHLQLCIRMLLLLSFEQSSMA